MRRVLTLTNFNLPRFNYHRSLIMATSETDGDGLTGVDLAQTCGAIAVLATLSDVEEPVNSDMNAIHDRVLDLGALLRSPQDLEGRGWFQMTLQGCKNILNQLYEVVKAQAVDASTSELISALADIQNTISLTFSLGMRYALQTNGDF